MKGIHLLFFCINYTFIANAQKLCVDYVVGVSVGFEIINDEKVITNEMLFNHPDYFKKNKSPLFLVDGNKVECIAYYNQDEIKDITVFQPKDAIPKYGNRGKNGVISVTLKEEVKAPYVEILTNKIYYKCKTENNLIDTTKEYYEKVNGKECSVLNLIDTSVIQTLYVNFDNEIRIKHLGIGWERVILTINNGSITGTFGERILRVKQLGFVTLTISSCSLGDKCKKKL